MGLRQDNVAKPDEMTRLDVVQLKSLKIIAITFITISVGSIQAELGVRPLNILRVTICLKYWLKTKSISLYSPVNGLKSALTSKIGQSCKTTEAVGDSFAIRMAKLAVACKLYVIKINSSWA